MGNVFPPSGIIRICDPLNYEEISTIQYNILNLPEIIQFKNGNQIKNTYDAGGHKLQSNYYTRTTTLSVPIAEGQIVTDVTSTDNYLLTGTDYVENFEYSFSNDQGDSQFDLDKIYNDEGYVSNLSSPQYYYYRKDHLGNNREVWRANDKTTVQYTQYYPSGLPWASNDGDNPGLQQRKYNGKEFIEMHGYDTYDFGHRGFYPAGDFFTTRDWKAEETPDVSPYSYAGNNPVHYRDENGDGLWDVVQGAAEAFVDDANPLSNLSGTSSRDNEQHYQIGQAIGHTVAALVGGAEMISGGGTAAGGAAFAVATSPTGVGAVVGGAVSAAGVAVAGHGAMMTTMAAKNMAGQKAKIDNASNGSTKEVYTPKDKNGNILKTEKTEAGNTKIDSEARGKPHTQLRTDKTGNYPQRTTFDSKGRKRADTHYTTHNEPEKSNPHKHTYYKDGRRQQ